MPAGKHRNIILPAYSGLYLGMLVCSHCYSVCTAAEQHADVDVAFIYFIAKRMHIIRIINLFGSEGSEILYVQSISFQLVADSFFVFKAGVVAADADAN